MYLWAAAGQSVCVACSMLLCIWQPLALFQNLRMGLSWRQNSPRASKPRSFLTLISHIGSVGKFSHIQSGRGSLLLAAGAEICSYSVRDSNPAHRHPATDPPNATSRPFLKTSLRRPTREPWSSTCEARRVRNYQISKSSRSMYEAFQRPCHSFNYMRESF